MLERSFLKRTRQLWKLPVAFGIAAAGLAGVKLSLSIDSAERSMLLIVASLVAGWTALVRLAMTVRCPICRDRLIWKAASNREARDWLGGLLRDNACPSCGAIV